MRVMTIALCLAAALGSHACDVGAQGRSQPREIDPNGLYPAGTVLTSPLTGLTFRLPTGFRAEWDGSMGALLALSNEGAFGAVWGWSEGTIEEIASQVGARLEARGIALQERPGTELSARRMRGTFDALSSEGNGVMHALIQVGQLGGVVAVVGLGQGVAVSRAADLVDGIGASLEWSEPLVAAWRREVTASVLSTPPDANGTSATLGLCTPAEYRYREAARATRNGAEHTGHWWLMGDLAGRAVLYMETTDGRTFQWPVHPSGDAFLIDGRRYEVTGPC